ncbi:MAG: hypothetical protein IJZ59_06245, partial [Alphaproteobacteria bacterium]|nr:hypothetical protein [Alphaproteobacteria bacterium]
MRKSTLFACGLGVALMSSTPLSAMERSVSDELVRRIYENAKHNNVQAIYSMEGNGVSIDTVDSYGNTALCVAIIKRDNAAYTLLKELGANPNHECSNVLKKEKDLTDKGGWELKSKYTVGGIIIAGGAIAALTTGGGGGSGDDGEDSGDGTDDGTGDDSGAGGDSGTGDSGGSGDVGGGDVGGGDVGGGDVGGGDVGGGDVGGGDVGGGDVG